MLAELTFFQTGVLGLNGSAVLLLYKLHRDVADVKRELRGVRQHHWAWIERLRRFAWPETFRAVDVPENHTP